MKFGTLALVPLVGARLLEMNEAAARQVSGVRDVVRVGDEAVAVVGDHMWAAKQGLEAVLCDRDQDDERKRLADNQ